MICGYKETFNIKSLNITMLNNDSVFQILYAKLFSQHE